MLQRHADLDRSGFTVKWSQQQAKAKPALRINELRKTFEDRLLSNQSAGWSCFQTAWEVLAEIQPSPTDVFLWMDGVLPVNPVRWQGNGSSTDHVKLSIHGRPQNSAPRVIIKLQTFAAKFDRLSSSPPFKLSLEALLKHSEPALPLKQLFQAVAATVRLAVEGRSFADHQHLALAVADSLQVHHEDIASMLSLDKIGVLFQGEGGSWSRSKYLSQSLVKPEDEVQATHASSPQPHSTTPGACSEQDKGDAGERRSPILIALGSNVGDRLSCIEDACRALDAEPDIRIVRTSSLYETKAMYVEDQAPFLNGVCEVSAAESAVHGSR